VVLAAQRRPAFLSGDLPALVGLVLPGDAIELSVWHLGAQVTRRALPDDGNARLPGAAADVPAPSPELPSGRLGLSLRPLQPDEMRVPGLSAGLVARTDKTAAPLVQRGGTKRCVALRPA
jgi:serine protease Do